MWKKEILLRALRQSILLLVIAGAVGLLVNTMRPSALPVVADWSPEARLKTDQGENMVVSLEEATELCTSRKAVFVDARSSEAFREGHIPCARNLPLNEVERHMDSFMADVPMEQMIIAYCDGVNCSLSEDLAKELSFRGYDNVKVLVNGWTRWVEAGLPVKQEDKPRSSPVVG